MLYMYYIYKDDIILYVCMYVNGGERKRERHCDRDRDCLEWNMCFFIL